VTAGGKFGRIRRVDHAARDALNEMIRSVVSADLDELYTRLERVERHLPSARAFSYHEHVAQRRRVVVALRADGLSIAAIGKRLGVAVSTVARDLEATPHTPPRFVTGLDGKRQAARKNGTRPAA
jgi:DNA-directed RNA polymerase specialized sigma24 family protein